MSFSGRVGGGGPGPAGPTTKNRPIFGKVRRGARGPRTKNAYFGRVGREGLGARGVPFYKKTIF